MTDLEKVKQGLDSELEEGGSCAACPYKGQAGLERCFVKLLIDVRKVLKEQEAVEPVKQIEQTEWTVCGNCHNHIISKWILCPYCGKPVKWE